MAPRNEGFPFLTCLIIQATVTGSSMQSTLLLLVLLFAVFSVYLPLSVFKFCVCFFTCSLLLQISTVCLSSSFVYYSICALASLSTAYKYFNV